MKSYLVIPVVIFLLFSGLLANSQDVKTSYHAVYTYKLVKKYNANDSENSFMKNFLSTELFDGLTYQCYSNPEYNYVVPKTKDELKGKKKITTRGGAVINGDFTLSGSSSFLIDYKKSIYVGFDDSDKVMCHAYKEISYSKSGRKKKINNYSCEEWRPKDKKYSAIHVWACPTVPEYINPGLFSKDIRGAIIILEIEHVEKYELTSLKKSNFSFKIPTCNKILDSFNMAKVLTDKR